MMSLEVLVVGLLRFSFFLVQLWKPSRSFSASWVMPGAPVSGVPCVSSGELFPGATLPADVGCPESQEVLVSTWKPACSLVEDASLGLRLPLSGSGCPSACLSVSVRGWVSLQPASSPLVFPQSPLFCERAWQCLQSVSQ